MITSQSIHLYSETKGNPYTMTARLVYGVADNTVVVRLLTGTKNGFDLFYPNLATALGHARMITAALEALIPEPIPVLTVQGIGDDHTITK